MHADGAECGNTAGGEELGDGDAADLAVEGARGGEGDVGGAEGEVAGGEKARAGGEGGVVGGERCAGEDGGGDDDGGYAAEAEVEQRGAEALGELGEGVVGHGREQMEVADDRERRRRRGEAATTTTASTMTAMD